MPFMTNILERKVLSCFDLVEHLVVSQIFFQCTSRNELDRLSLGSGVT